MMRLILGLIACIALAMIVLPVAYAAEPLVGVLLAAVTMLAAWHWLGAETAIGLALLVAVLIAQTLERL